MIFFFFSFEPQKEGREKWKSVYIYCTSMYALLIQIKIMQVQKKKKCDILSTV